MINWTGNRLTLRIEKIAHGGVSVARHEGRVVFVSGAIPGESVVAEVFEDAGKAFCRASVVEVLEPSPDRVPHFWKAAKSGIGGVEFGHISLTRQRSLKSEVINEAMARMAKLETNVQVQFAGGDQDGLHYRTRIQLQVAENGTPGFYRERTHDVVSVSEIPLAVADIEELGLHLKNWSGVEKIKISASSLGEVQWWVDKKQQGAAQLIERAGGRTFRLTNGGFWQVHSKAAELLLGEMLDLVKIAQLDDVQEVFDLYSGVGLFGANLAQRMPGVPVLAVESNKSAVADGERSSKDLKNLTFLMGDVLQALRGVPKAETPSHQRLVVLDPPRSGAGTKVIGELKRIEPKHIIYVACDPVALARDVQLLQPEYALVELRSFDIFPHTHHFESIALLSRN